MTDEDALRHLFDEWARGDFRGGVALFAHDIRFSATQPEGQVHESGVDGVRRFMARFLPEWEGYAVELDQLEDLGGGRYLVAATQRGTGTGSGVEITSPVYVAIAMHDGRIEQLEFHMSDRAAALAALGRTTADP